ncbi:MAG: GNAT family N-acetyltransferase [Planctomycetota bacterium]|jgi:ribosomal protein S18 acetylase RimI-like enzyme|nr:GNAT family N-acetyltransferase [Planctomycetota bacterium]
MDIRVAAASDRQLLIDALAALVDHIAPQEPYLHRIRSDADPGAWVDTCLADPGGHGLIAERDGAYQACALGRMQDPAIPISGIGQVGHIAMFHVVPAARRHGLARRLCQEMEDFFRHQGAAWVELSYLSTNTEAVATWHALDYQPFRVMARKAL